MPNWVYNNVRVYGKEKDVAEFMQKVEENKDSLFDSFLPMPQTFKDWDTTNHPDGKGLNVGMVGFDWKGGEIAVTAEYIKGLKKATKEQREKYGVVGWYDWRRTYWGTKWEADCVECGFNSFSFNTAWNTPLPVLEKWAKDNPELGFLLTYADEDTHGGNCGAVIYHNGKMIANLDGSQVFGVSMRNDWDNYYEQIVEWGC